MVIYDGGGCSIEGIPTSWSTDAYELTGCGVLDAVRWAQAKAPDGAAWAVGLVEDRPSPDGVEHGFTYLEGYDLNALGPGLSDWESRQVDEMLARRSRVVVKPACSTNVWPGGTAATPLEGPSVTWRSE